MLGNKLSKLGLSCALLVSACGGFDPQTFEQSIDMSVEELALAPAGSYGCTRPAFWWKTHHRYALLPSNRIPWPVDENMLICGRTMLGLLEAAPVTGDVWGTLTRYTIVANLNVRSGASAPASVATALETAKRLVQQCAIAPADVPQVWPLVATLDAYSAGRVGPGTCP